MANFETEPKFTELMRKFETSDPAHADLFNTIIGALLNNDVFLRNVANQLLLQLQQHISDNQTALDTYYQQSSGYTDQKIADLIGGAPTTLDTLGEIAKAMKDNEDVVAALDEAMGKKASAAEFDSHVKDTGNPHKLKATQAEAVSFSESQPLSETQKATARDNIGATEKLTISEYIYTPGWYRFATKTNGYSSYLISINRGYSHGGGPEEYLLSVETGFNKVSIVQLNSNVEDQNIRSFRVVYKTNSELYFDFESTENKGNTVYISIFPLGKVNIGKFSLIDFEKDPDITGYNVKEIALSSTPIVGDLQGTAAEAQKAKEIIDAHDGRKVTFAYGAPGLEEQPDWIAAWTKYAVLRALSPSKMKVGSADRLSEVRTIFGRSFDGGSNINGWATFFGQYNAKESGRYTTSALQIRENDRVGNVQSDIGYAPSIGFHWAERVGALLALDKGGIFRFLVCDNAGNRKATISANLDGLAYTANKLNQIDTRSVNSPPEYYMTGEGAKGIVVELKKTTVIGLPNDFFAQVITFTPWSDSSGGYPSQIAVGYRGLYYRTGESLSSWRDWVYLSDNAGAELEYDPSITSKGNTLVVRDQNQDIFARYINSALTRNESVTIDQIIVQNSTDNYFRGVSKDKFLEELGLKYTINEDRETLVKRTNTGDIRGRYFESGSQINDAKTADQVIVCEPFSPYYKKMSVTAFKEQLGIPTFSFDQSTKKLSITIPS